MNRSISSYFGRWLSLLLFAVAVTTAANAESVEIDGLVYELNATGRCASVTSCNVANLAANVVIPASVTYNGNTYNVTEIADGSFCNCTDMESVSIPGSVVSIGTFFSKIYGESSAWISAPSYNLPFRGCSNLKSIRFEDSESEIDFGLYYRNYKYNGEYRITSHDLFEDCPLEELYIGRNITTGGNYDCGQFRSKSITKATFGDFFTIVPDRMFYYNNSLAVVELPCVEKIGDYAFSGCKRLTTVNFGKNIKIVGPYAFQDCSSLTKLTFPDSLTEIGNNAFSGCSSVTEITVGSGLRSIGERAFQGCGSFTAIILPEGFTTMGEGAFEGCGKLTVAKLGSSLTSVPASAFKDCHALSEMFIPASVISIGDMAFYNDYGIANLTMEEGVQSIGKEVFYNNSGLIRLEIPGTVTSIGNNSFYGCTRIAYLTFRKGDEELVISNSETKSSLKSGGNVGYDYFYDCPIRFLTIGRNMTYRYSSNSSPFYGKESIVSVTFTPNVTFLYHSLLAKCSGIRKLTAPDGLTHVYSYALSECTQLTELEFPEPLVLLDDYACSGNTALASVELKETPGNDLNLMIGKGAFYGCEKLTSLVFPSKTVSIGDNCFRECKGLETLTFVDSKKTISLGMDTRYSYRSMPLFDDSNLKTLYVGRNIDYSDGYSVVEKTGRRFFAPPHSRHSIFFLMSHSPKPGL